MTTKRHNPSDNESYVLSYLDVASVLREENLGGVVTALVDEIEITYKDKVLKSVDRLGWSKPPDALELMGCHARDFTCAKLISSVSSANGTPTVTGTLVCAEVELNQVRLVCDAAFMTSLRTAASTAAVMRRAAPGVSKLGIIGTGLEGTAHAVVLALEMESVESIKLFDLNKKQALRASEETRKLLDRDNLLDGRKVSIEVCDAESDVYDCDAIVTATFAERTLFSKPKDIRDGTFIAAVGADLKSKRELPKGLYDRAKFIADDLRQCLKEGELQYAKDRLGVEGMARDHRGELHDGRIVSAAAFLKNPVAFTQRADEAITIYDSTGFSGQDLAMARVMLRLLEKSGWPRRPWNPPKRVSFFELLGA